MISVFSGALPCADDARDGRKMIATIRSSVPQVDYPIGQPGIVHADGRHSRFSGALQERRRHRQVLDRHHRRRAGRQAEPAQEQKRHRKTTTVRHGRCS